MQEYITTATASRSDLIRLLAYYCQRMVTTPWIRRFANRLVLLVLRRRYSALACGDPARGACPEFRQNGYVRLNRLLSQAQCAEIRSYLAACSMLDSRGSGASFGLDAVPEGCRIGDYPLVTVVNCPHVMEIANHPQIMRLAADYLGFTPVITGLSLRWSFPSPATPDKVQHFHRDCEVGSIKVMIYLTDVDDDSGPHTFAACTHLDRIPIRLRTHRDDEVLAEHVTILGVAGTTFAIDTRGLHKGAIPRKHPRLMLGIQYALLPCMLFDYKPVPYTGSMILPDYVNRLVAAGLQASQSASMSRQ